MPGKQVAGKLYLHRSAIEAAPGELREAVDRASATAPPELEWNVAKMDPEGGRVSLLRYENFEGCPFPELAESATVDTVSGRVRYQAYTGENRPILHRKELLVGEGFPGREQAEALSAAIDREGLLRDGHRVGYRRQWEERLAERGFCVLEGRLERLESAECHTQGGDEVALDVAPPPEVARHRTAITRRGLSRPMQALARYGYLDGERAVFDFGCGRGEDLERLRVLGVECSGFDPYYAPDEAKREAELVNLGFVLNVIESPEERVRVLGEAHALARELLVVAVMLSAEQAGAGAGAEAYRDGILTNRGTFQKYFTQTQARDLIVDTLGVEPVAVGPGVFFAFRTESLAQEFLERRNRRARLPVPSPGIATRDGRKSATQRLFEAHEGLFTRLYERLVELGREPVEAEFAETIAVVEAAGSLRRALRVVRTVFGDAQWQHSARAREADLRVYLALERFSPRRDFAQWSETLRRDIRHFFGSARQAQEQAQALLLSAGSREAVLEDCAAAAGQGLGQLSANGRSFQIASYLIGRLPERLRVYVGCGSWVYGDPEAADLLKIHVTSGKLSLMRFDDFEGEGLPRMLERVKIDFARSRLDVFTYGEGFEPPLLYWKSRFVEDSFPAYGRQREFEAELAHWANLDPEADRPGPEVLQEALRRVRRVVAGMELRRASDVPNPQAPCGRYHWFADFIGAGESAPREMQGGLDNRPREPESYNALADLCHEVLDPLMDYFGGIDLTYGFACGALSRRIRRGVAAELDQHAACERKRTGAPVCERGGAACDFLVADEDMAEVALWIVENTAFDRLYFYGREYPLHVSFGPQHSREVVIVSESAAGRRVPRVERAPSEFFGALLKEPLGSP